MKTCNFDKIVLSDKFAYFLGYFSADGCFYKSGRSTRFEFSDGTSVVSELCYSEELLSKIREYLEGILNVQLPKLRKRENRYILALRNKFLEQIFLSIGLLPGKKTYSVRLPSFYKKTEFENYFWQGVMDGDGMVARNSRKVSLESVSKNLIDDFKNFLDRKNISYTCKERMLNNLVYQVFIKSAELKSFSKVIMFSHPRKRIWLLKHLNKKEHYSKNEFAIDKYLVDDLIDYFKIFEGKNVFVVDGIALIGKRRKRKNVRLSEIEKILGGGGDVLLKLSNYRFKASKGTPKSIMLPLKYNSDFETILKYARVTNGGIRYSRKFIESYNEDPRKIVEITEDLFDIKPSVTGKKEIIFSNILLKLLLLKIKVLNIADFSP